VEQILFIGHWSTGATTIHVNKNGNGATLISLLLTATSLPVFVSGSPFKRKLRLCRAVRIDPYSRQRWSLLLQIPWTCKKPPRRSLADGNALLSAQQYIEHHVFTIPSPSGSGATSNLTESADADNVYLMTFAGPVKASMGLVVSSGSNSVGGEHFDRKGISRLAISSPLTCGQQRLTHGYLRLPLLWMVNRCTCLHSLLRQQ
jgi:hypothetical protein